MVEDARGGAVILAMLVTSAGMAIGLWCVQHLQPHAWQRILEAASSVYVGPL